MGFCLILENSARLSAAKGCWPIPAARKFIAYVQDTVILTIVRAAHVAEVTLKHCIGSVAALECLGGDVGNVAMTEVTALQGGQGPSRAWLLGPATGNNSSKPSSSIPPQPSLGVITVLIATSLASESTGARSLPWGSSENLMMKLSQLCTRVIVNANDLQTSIRCQPADSHRERLI